jgi:hypothetical protein
MQASGLIMVSAVFVAVLILGLTICTLVTNLRRLAEQVIQMNERLMVLVAAKDVGPDAARALVASSIPKKTIPGVATGKNTAEVQKKSGLTVTYGA